MNNKIWHAVEVEIARVGETAATVQLWAFNTTGVEISEDVKNPDFITLRAYFNSAPDIEKLRERILRDLKLIYFLFFSLFVFRFTSLFRASESTSTLVYEPIAICLRMLICFSFLGDQ